MRTDPRPTADTIGAYYPADYGPYHAADSAAVSRGSSWRARLRHLLGLNARALPPVAPGRLLEVGCANGSWLASVAAGGWQVQGIEFSETAAAQARARGLDVQVASVETAVPPGQPVDVVAAWMVLEHLHEPVAALRRLRAWVRPDGWLIASVPDASAFERRLFGSRWFALQLPTHLYQYTPSTLKEVLAHAGWRVTRVRWQRNANNLIRSLGYLAEDLRAPWLCRFATWLGDAKAAGKVRALLAVALGAVRQTGRIEIWAKPDPNHRQSEP